MDNLQFDNEGQNSAIKPDKKQLTKYAVIGGMAVVALIVIIVIFNALFGSSYKTPIKKSMALINKHAENNLDYSKYSNLKSMYEYQKLNEEIMDGDDDEYEEYIDELADEFGDNFKVKYKIAKAKKLDKDDLEDLADDIEEYYEELADESDDTLDTLEEVWDEEDVSSKDQKKLEKAYKKYIKECGKLKITAAYEVKLECKIKGSEDSAEFKLKDVIIIKVNGEWVFRGGSLTPSTIYYKTIAE